MRVGKALRLAREEMDRFGLDDWSVRITNSKTVMGRAYLLDKKIHISSNLLKYFPYKQIRDVILHEISHALDYLDRGRSTHDRIWKSKATRVGANPKRRIENGESFAQRIPTKYTYVCKKCGSRVGASRRLKNLDRKICTRCYKEYGVRTPLSDFKIIQNW